VSTDNVEAMLQSMYKLVGKGHTFFKHNSAASEFYIVISGTVDLFSDDSTGRHLPRSMRNTGGNPMFTNSVFYGEMDGALEGSP